MAYLRKEKNIEEGVKITAHLWHIHQKQKQHTKLIKKT
jgi:hypothetical protein